GDGRRACLRGGGGGGVVERRPVAQGGGPGGRRGAPGGAARGGDEGGGGRHPAGREAGHVRGRHVLPAVGRAVSPPEVVGEEEHDVRLLGRGSGRKAETPRRAA